ncbi:hypothetical protein ABZV65_19620 [Streptomyces bauhiniae]|uniref:hypothetical protein n=1 Tax=Streptomyces bauhiniae TaxID=2340725 RepID=UPI00339F255A
MTSSSPAEAPARRRRNARLIATLTRLVGDCAAAASAVYDPIADAAPDQTGVPVSLQQLATLTAAAGVLLDHARKEDDARWPDLTAQEQADHERTYAARCAAAEADLILDNAVHPDASDHTPGMIPMPNATQLAAMGLAGAGADFATAMQDDPETAVADLLQAADTGEFTVNQILNEAADTIVLAGLLLLREARAASDPSMAAERCLLASRRFVLAVTVLSADIPT